MNEKKKKKKANAPDTKAFLEEEMAKSRHIMRKFFQK
jgi:hypothetical protein